MNNAAFATGELAEAVEAVKRDGQSRGGLLCPRCVGGRSGERSVSVYQSAVCVKARCHRASCNWWDKWVHLTGPALPEDSAQAPRPYEGRLVRCDIDMRRTLMQRYRLAVTTIEEHILHAPDDEYDNRTIYMPVRGPLGGERGGNLKRLGTTGRRKTHTYCTNRNVPYQAWYGGTEREHLVVVEDQLSAMRVAQLGLNSVALIGTSMTTEKWAEIREVAHREMVPTIYLALDRDAYVQQLRIARRFCPTTPIPVKPVLLEQDFKDSRDDEIVAALS